MKSHVTFSKQQRHGIFLLITIIVILQSIYFYLHSTNTDVHTNEKELLAFEKEVDSLRELEIAQRIPKIYPVNPNYITDYRGALFGMSTEEIDRLLAFRNQGEWINSVKQFQTVTRISDSLLETIQPYLKFPEWVNSKPRYRSFNNNQPKTWAQKIDLNKATAEQLQQVNGIGKVLSNRIVKFRNAFIGGFIADVQLHDVYGLTPETIDKIMEQFTVKTPKDIIKINLNTAEVDQLVTIQHIDYELAHQIVQQRKLREGFKTIEELKKVKGFPADKIEIIQLYLQID